MKMFRAAALTTAALCVSIVSITAAAAAPVAPAFLSAAQLPAASTPWQADPVRPGAAADVCTRGIAPRAGSRHREFRTELDTTARQTITVAASESKAKALATKLRGSVESCLDRLKERYPTLEGEAFHHGRINVEEGAHVYSIDTSDTEIGSTDISLYSVGRDGKAVTVIVWGQLGDLDGAPLEGFKKTTRTAVAKLY
ncbi:hypothetical protein [Streptomyces sp. AK02-01A]|uniref:hypothetical protein n=1 Tax=Streptomyces sp. AK02-01A TaxID=3028648 RepID=UPI0029B9AC46|nr:hypothetical protein [Streptomyces sp. AK02-01A]MDX3850274.1 hypothetical protein [Streptomyces sp. AK02-01A]